MSAPKHIVVGVVLYPDALPLDFIGPTCLLNALSPTRLSPTSPLLSSSDPKERTQATFQCIHIGESLEPVKCSFGTVITPDKTFADVRRALAEESQGSVDGGVKVDVLLLPGGTGARPWNASEGLKEFVKWAGENVETVLTGALNGHKATTNKKAFLECKLMGQKYWEDQQEPKVTVEWIPHARWVRSGKFWTASGVSAGMDMACAFIDEVAGEAGGKEARAYAEYTSNAEGDDPWAAVNGLE